MRETDAELFAHDRSNFDWMESSYIGIKQLQGISKWLFKNTELLHFLKCHAEKSKEVLLSIFYLKYTAHEQKIRFSEPLI